jgi:ABC-2 type transport system ATP-binding protein
MTRTVLETHKLTKHYGKVIAVNDVNLQVKEGEVFGFLGPNGAGKTTTIGMALGLIHPTAGRVELFGQPVSPGHTQPLTQVGSLMGRPTLLPYLTGRSNLKLLARLYDGLSDSLGFKGIEDVLELVDLSFGADRKVKTYSTGMKQRLGLAAALLHQPSLVILDEPTNGLDPAGMRDIRNLISHLAESGVTVFLSSHLLHEVEQVCDRIAVINHGRIIAQGLVQELLGYQEDVVKVRVSSPEKTRQALGSLAGITHIESNGAYVEIRGVPSEQIVTHLVQQNIPPGEVLVRKSDLESLYLGLTQT